MIFIDINVSGHKSKTQKAILIFLILDSIMAGIITDGGDVPNTKIKSNFLFNNFTIPTESLLLWDKAYSMKLHGGSLVVEETDLGNMTRCSCYQDWKFGDRKTVLDVIKDLF